MEASGPRTQGVGSMSRFLYPLSGIGEISGRAFCCPKRTAVYAVGMCVIALLYILLTGVNLYLAVAGDQNTISFSACHDRHFDL